MRDIFLDIYSWTSVNIFIWHDSLSLILLLVENKIFTRENLNHARNTRSTFCKRYTNRVVYWQNFPFSISNLDPTWKSWYRFFLVLVSREGRNAHARVVDLFTLPIGLPSLQHEAFSFNFPFLWHEYAKQPQRWKGRQPIFASCIRYFFLHGIYSEVSHFIESLVASLLGGLCAYVPIPQWYENIYPPGCVRFSERVKSKFRPLNNGKKLN